MKVSTPAFGVLKWWCDNFIVVTSTYNNRWITTIVSFSFSLCTVPVPDTSCNTFGGSCEHYEQCVEPLLRCGENGFALAYGRRHCEVVQQIRSNTSLPSWMLNWLQDHERCLQRRVLELATDQQCSTPNPISCLKFEFSALVAFEECFTRNISLLCDSNELIENSTTLAQQISNVAKQLGIDNYYSHNISKAITRAISNTCTHPNASDIVSMVKSPSLHRVVFCVTVNSDEGNEDNVQINFTESQYVNVVANKLRQPATDFRYAGRDPGRCRQENLPAALGNINTIFHFIIWQPNNNMLLSSLEPSYFVYIDPITFLDFFSLNTGHCGDGIRQAGEMCDTGLKNFERTAGGCNDSCMPYNQYECDTMPLVLSTCHRTVCGDGLRTSDEECDDGDNATCDGCNAHCQVEDGYECRGPYNGTSNCLLLPKVTTASPVSTTAPSSQTTTVSLSTATPNERFTPPPLDSIGNGNSALSSNCFSCFILLSTLLTLLIFL